MSHTILGSRTFNHEGTGTDVERAHLRERARLRAILLRLLQDVGVALGRAESVERAIWTVMRLVCRSGPWHVAHAYRPEELDGRTLLVPTGSWFCKDKKRFQAQQLADFSASVWAGKGLIGHVFHSGRPIFIGDVGSMSEGARPAVSDVGLRAGLILPTDSDYGVNAVLEIYSPERVEFPNEWLSTARSICAQLGELIARKELERAVADHDVKERRAMSRELHDTIGQQATGLDLMASRLRRSLERVAPQEVAELDKIIEVVRELKAQVRAFVDDLGPLEPTPDDLASSLQKLAARAAALHDIVCQFESDDTVSGLEPTVAQQLLYVAREAVHNSVKHGAAKRVVLTLRGEPERTVLGIRDNGTGFTHGPHKPAGRGITIMRYRAGLIGATLKIASQPGSGTVVRCVVPKRADN